MRKCEKKGWKGKKSSKVEMSGTGPEIAWEALGDILHLQSVFSLKPRQLGSMLLISPGLGKG